MIKKRIYFENTPRRRPSIHMWCQIYYLILPARSLLSPITASCWEDDTSWVTAHAFPNALLYPLLATLRKVFDLDLFPMTLTLTFKLDLDILPPDPHAEIQIRMSVCLVRRVVTHVHTDRQTHDVKTITPVADAGCKYTLEGTCTIPL